MVGVQWPGAVERLAFQLSQAEAADRRVDEAKSVGSGRPNRDDLMPAEYQRQLHTYVQTPEYRASDREVRVAVALSTAHNTTYAGISRAFPSPGPKLRLGSPDDLLVQEVARQARLLQARRVGYRKRDSLYEAFIPDGTPLGGCSLPPIRGLSPEASRRANRLLGRGSGMRVQPGRYEEFDQLHADYFAVWDRSRAYAAAVLALLRARS